jgi:ankyrin repeat protein
MMRCVFLCAITATRVAFAASSDDFYRAIRANDLPQLKILISKGDVNVRDRRGATPLMYAAAVGSVDAVKTLLQAGADAKAKNGFNATALMWATTNLEKVRLLVDAGADVNATSKQGMTPLLVAASNAGAIEVVRLLLAKGVSLQSEGKREDAAPDPSKPIGLPQQGRGGKKFSPLIAAANANDLDMARLFVEKGVDVNVATEFGATALQFAAGAGNAAMVKLLIAKGADVNAGTTASNQVRKGFTALNHLTPLMFAAPFGSPELIRTLLDAGAKVNARDIRDMTPLMLAVSSETQDPEVVRLLLSRGADVNAKSVLGETALDWANKFGNPEVIGLLHGKARDAANNAQPPAAATASPLEAMTKSVALLQRSGIEFFKESGCVGCHHQNFTAMAVRAARERGVHVDEAAADEHLKMVKTQWMAFQEGLLQRVDPPGAEDTLMYSLLGLAAAGYPPDAITDAMTVNVAAEQTPDGSWSAGGISRSPIEEGSIARRFWHSGHAGVRPAGIEIGDRRADRAGAGLFARSQAEKRR